MAVARVASAEDIRTGITDPHTFSYAGGTPKGIAIAIIHGVSATSLITSVSYGGVALALVVRAVDTVTEAGVCEIWFLGAGVPTGTQTVSIDLTSGSTTDVHTVVWELSGGGDLAVVDFGYLQEDVANPTVVMHASGANKISLCAMYGGGAAPGGTVATGNTLDHDHDHGAFYSQTCYETTVDNASHTIGWSTLGSDDVALAAIAVTEVTEAPGYLLRTASSADVSTPDHASLDIAGDIDLRALVNPDRGWAATTADVFIAKRSGASIAQLSYRLQTFRQASSTRLRLNWKEAGGTERNVDSTTNFPPTTFSGPNWVRATLDVDNGASQYACAFYTSTDPINTDPAAVTWTALGTTVTGATGVTTIFNSTSPVELGASGGGTLEIMAGRLYYAEIRSGIGGTIVANPDFRTDCQKDSATQLTDDQGRVWTVTSPAVWVSPLVCFPPTRSRVEKQRRFASHLAM